MEDIEDILGIEVPLVKSEDLSRAYGAGVSFLDGSVFPITHTVKDVRNAVNLLNQRDLDEAVYVDLSWGNSALSMAKLVDLEGRFTGARRIVVSIIPRGYEGLRKDLERNGALVIQKTQGQLEDKITMDDLVEMAVSELRTRGIEWSEDRSNVFRVEREESYGKPYAPLIQDIPPKTDYVFIPFGSGEIATGIFHGLLESYRDASKMPTIVCVESEDKGNLKGKNLTYDKTLTRYSTFRPHLERLSEQYKGKIEFMTVSAYERDREYRLLQMLRINAEPAAALAFVGARKYDFPSADKEIVVLNTGKGRIYQKKRKILTTLYKSKLTRAAAAVLISLGLSTPIAIDRYQKHQSERAALTYVADYAADLLGDNINSAEMSNRELGVYIFKSKERIRGPPNYFL